MEQPKFIINQPTMLIQEEPRGPSMLIEIPVLTNGSTSITLPPVQELQSDQRQTIVIKGIRLVTFAEQSNLPTGGQVNAPLTELVKMSLSIYAEGWIKGFEIPLLSLNNTFIEGSGIPYRDRTMRFENWQALMWNKTKIILGNGTGGTAGTPYGVLLEVDYVRFDLNGELIVGPMN